MGLDIVAISKARRVKCDGSEEVCDVRHVPVESTARRADGLKRGCYLPGRGGWEVNRYVTYYGYNQWRAELSLLALGVPPEEVWAHPRRYRGKPFVELIDFPDGGVATIGPKTAAKLYADFVAFASKAKKHYFQAPPQAQPPLRKRRGKAKRHDRARALSAVQEAAQALGAEVTDEEQDIEWMWQLYRDFRRLFKVASDKGLVSFC